MFKKILSIVPVAALTLAVSANAQASTITVQKGDTLWDLANANNTTVETIQKVNHLTTDLIHPGDVLTIAQQKQYIVKTGDTLWDIARDYGVTVDQIQDWNELHTDLIHPDLNLVIFDGLENSNLAVTDKPIIPTTKETNESTTKATAPSTKTITNENKSGATVSSTSKETPKEITREEIAPTTNSENSKENTPEKTAPSTNNEAPKESTPEATAPSEDHNAVKEFTAEASAYTASCEGCTGITATGIDLKANPNAKVISVDPSVIPLGSKVYVEGYGEAVAGDTGGNIKGNRIDVFVPTEQEAANFGVKQLKVTILD